MQNITWGIYGPGSIANTFVAAMQMVPAATIKSVAGRTPAKAIDFAQRHGIPKALPDLDALVADDEIQAVYIATTHNAHCPAACTCLAAGKAVLCEKPLAMNAREVQQIIAAAESNQSFMMEALWTRFLPAWQRVRELLARNTIGTPRMVHANFGVGGSFDPKGRLLNKELAGGALLDLGVYPIAMAQMILPGPVIAVQAVGEIGPTGVDIRTAMTMQFANHAFAQLSAAIGTRTDNSLTIAGDQGQIRVQEPFWGAREIEWTSDGKNRNRESHPHRCNGFEEQIEAVNNAIRADQIQSTIMPHADSLAIATIMDTVRAQIGLSYPADHYPTI
ncbi:MAG: Gfo/Idh/MocA family protein [Kiritimatiellia bacterium]